MSQFGGMAMSKATTFMYNQFVADHQFCWCCGVGDREWYGQALDGIDYDRKLENHHIRRGVSRVDDRRNLSRLCTLCHALTGNAAIRLEGKLLPVLTLNHVLWLKHIHDVLDRPFLRSISVKPWLPATCRPPKFWQRLYLGRHSAYPTRSE